MTDVYTFWYFKIMVITYDMRSIQYDVLNIQLIKAWTLPSYASYLQALFLTVSCLLPASSPLPAYQPPYGEKLKPKPFRYEYGVQGVGQGAAFNKEETQVSWIHLGVKNITLFLPRMRKEMCLAQLLFLYQMEGFRQQTIMQISMMGEKIFIHIYLL